MTDTNLLLGIATALSIALVGLLGVLIVLARTWMRARQRCSELENQLALERQRAQDRELQCEKMETDLQQLRQQLQESEAGRHVLEKEMVERNTVLAKEREAFQERIELLEKAEEKLKHTFQSLSSQALQSNNSAFLELANATFEKLKVAAKGDLELKEKAISEMVRPIQDGLKQFDSRIQEMEKGRVAQISTVSELVMNLTKANEQMRVETSNLVSALRAPNIRGQWGEMQLRRTIEISGMVRYCDFVEQKKIGDEDVNLRPDVVINLPNRRQVVIDSKAPLNAYLEACETTDAPTRELKLKLHAKQLREHLKRLGQKAYHDHLEESPEFVVLFLPGEVFYSAALEQDPALIEYGVDHKVLIATPTTLIALLKAIAYGWKNQEIAEKAGEISKIGRDLYESVVKMLEHLVAVRRHLNQTVDAFNKTLASTDRRLLPRIRKFKKLNAGTEKPIPTLERIETPLQMVELPELDDADSDDGEEEEESESQPTRDEA